MTAPVTTDLGTAAAAWNAAHPAAWPRRGGTCPVCADDGCFGTLPGSDGARWACFSTGHPADGSRGVKGTDVVHGDALDIEAHRRGWSRVEVLQADGYLAPGRAGPATARRPPAPAPPVDWRGPAAVLAGARVPAAPPGDGDPVLAGTHWSGKGKPQGEATSTTWSTLVGGWRSPGPVPPGGKGELAAWSPTRFKNNYRNADNVLDVGALVLDFDCHPGDLALDPALVKLAAAEGLDIEVLRGVPGLDAAALRAVLVGVLGGHRWTAHTTASSLPGAWRWRVVVPLSRRVTAAEHAALVCLVRLALLDAGCPAQEVDTRACMNAAGLWFVPVAVADYESLEEPGAVLDADDALRGAARDLPVGATPESVAAALRDAVKAARAALWPPAPGDDGPPPPGDDDGPPVLAKVAGPGILYVRTREGGWVASDERLLRGELECQGHPGVELWSVGRDGEARPTGVAVLIERHAVSCEGLFHDLTRDRSEWRWTRPGGGELSIACGRRPPVEPARHEEVDRWLRLLAGDSAEKVLDWLATVTDLQWPTAALYLCGPRGTGKGLLAAGVARLWGQSVTSYADITGNFNSALRTCPVVLLDEGCRPPADGSASFRSLVGETRRPLTEKYRPAATLVGAVRLIIAANNMDALKLRESLTPEDEAAIGQRILFVRGGAEAAAYLRGLGGRLHTAAWVDDCGRPGALPRHVAWLAANRTVVRGERFLVEGAAGAWLRNAGLRGGLVQEVLATVARVAAGGCDTWRQDRRPVWYEPGCALVSADRLQRAWRDLTGSTSVPSLTATGTALATVAAGPARRVGGLRGPRPLAHPVPADRVVEVAELLGIGDPDHIRERFTGTPHLEPTPSPSWGPPAPGGAPS